MKKLKFWIDAIIGYMRWRKYKEVGCLLCKKRDKGEKWCINRRKNKMLRKYFCYKFKLGYTKTR